MVYQFSFSIYPQYYAQIWVELVEGTATQQKNEATPRLKSIKHRGAWNDLPFFSEREIRMEPFRNYVGWNGKLMKRFSLGLLGRSIDTLSLFMVVDDLPLELTIT
jgi:hypothetical protein